MYDYLIVGAGLFGAVFAHEAALKGKKVKVIEKRNHIAGNIYTREEEGIQVHQYGAHIFHTSDKEIWDQEKGYEPHYPVNNDRNNHLYKSYKKLADEQGNVIFGGRLGHYRYYDMHQVIGAALQCVRNELD